MAIQSEYKSIDRSSDENNQHVASYQSAEIEASEPTNNDTDAYELHIEDAIGM